VKAHGVFAVLVFFFVVAEGLKPVRDVEEVEVVFDDVLVHLHVVERRPQSPVLLLDFHVFEDVV
jgi:hypothetical protein